MDSSQRTIEHPGKVLKALRISKSLTLSELSEKTSLPASTLSKLENGKMMLTYEKLVRLGAALQEDLGRLLISPQEARSSDAGARGRRSIARAGENLSVHFKVQRHTYPAADFSKKKMLPVLIDVTAENIEELGGLLSHQGEEYIYVIEGAMELYTEFYEPLRLEKGDSVYFDSGMRHGYVQSGDGPCRVLVMCTGEDVEMLSAAARAGAPSDGSNGH